MSEPSLSGWPEHAEHGRWRRVKPCVYCACGTRLYNGGVPKNVDEQREMAAVIERIATAITPEAREAGAKLRQQRFDRDLSLREMARILGVSPPVLSRMERGSEPIPPEWEESLPTQAQAQEESSD